MATLDGVAMIERALMTVRRTKASDVVVVLGNRADEIRKELRGGGFRVVMNKRFREGMSTSLKAGLRALSGETDAVVIVLADQPFVTPELIDELITRHLNSRSQIVTSASGQLVSPPVLFGRSVFSEIEALEGDVGAKSIVMRHKEAERVEVDRETLLDVDTPEDIEKARRLVSRRS